MQQQYHVRLVDEDDLPADQAWTIGITHRGERFLFVKRGALTPAVLEEAWEAAQRVAVAPAAMRAIAV